jgi:uncharacterized membrane protein (DUF485 family)
MTNPHVSGAERVADADPAERVGNGDAAQRAFDGGPTAAGSEHHPEIDWEAAERSPEFRKLVSKRRAFVVPATAFFLAWYFGFIVLAGYAPGFMGETFITEGLTVGYALALSQFVMTWGLAAWYLRRSTRVFDPLAEKAAERALRAGDGKARSGRFERTRVEPAAAPGEVTSR